MKKEKDKLRGFSADHLVIDVPFDELFPSLKGKDIDGSFEGMPIKVSSVTHGTEQLVFKQVDIVECCIDKQRLRESINAVLVKAHKNICEETGIPNLKVDPEIMTLYGLPLKKAFEEVLGL